MRLHEAQAAAIKMINEAKPGAGYITLKKLESAEKVADGNATKIIIPSDLQNVVGLFNTVAESKDAK
jgi:regulator of protease activity HflC (stomatin/prohibitin superfamily)